MFLTVCSGTPEPHVKHTVQASRRLRARGTSQRRGSSGLRHPIFRAPPPFRKPGALTIPSAATATQKATSANRCPQHPAPNFPPETALRRSRSLSHACEPSSQSIPGNSRQKSK